MNRQQDTRLTALYSRLSRDDEQVGDSNSIKNQKAMLEDYAAKNGFPNPVHFSDDGFTGGNFDRPGWKRLIEEVEAGKVGAIISKDLSRVGRDYLQTGFYTEVFFREKGVRFIAIANNIDSENRESGEFAPFLNIMSEWYLRDASRKVKAAHRARGVSGKRLTFNPIYGYKLDPKDKNRWIIDPEAAEVVRRIYALTIEGKGPTQIARILADDKVERPSYYMHMRGLVDCSNAHDLTTPYVWSGGSIARMIKKAEYKGCTVNFRTNMESYKDKRPKNNPEENWLVFENTHEAIVAPNTWETAQRCRKTVRRMDHGEANPLTGLVFCADCGAKLYNHRMPYPTSHVDKKGRMYHRPPKDVYACSTYNLTGRRFNLKCTNHQIRTSVLRELVLDAIKTVSGFVKSNEADFIKQVRETSAIRQSETAKEHKRRIAKEQKRISELNTLIRRIYEDNVAGRLTDKRFEILSAEYEQEQNRLEKSAALLQKELDNFHSDTARADQFIGIVKRYTDFSELTPAMLAEFIEKIVVHEVDKSSGERKQEVDIHLNFIGKFDIPLPEPTPEEIMAGEKARLKRERHREAQRRYAERQEQKETIT